MKIGIPVVKNWTAEDLGIKIDNTNFEEFYKNIRKTKGVEGILKFS